MRQATAARRVEGFQGWLGCCCSADGARGVSYPLFQQVMNSLGIHFPNEERIFQLFDVNADNYVDYRELVMGLALLREHAPADGSYFYVSESRPSIKNLNAQG